MNRSTLRARGARILMSAGLAFAAIGPATAPVAAADPLVLNAGTDQDLQVLNPFSSVVVADFEAFTLNYDTLVGWGQDLEPVPGFAESWAQDGNTWTFKIRSGMKWSDGQPATAEDAAYSIQLVLDATAKSDASADGYYLGQGYLEAYITNAGVTAVSVPDPETLVVTTEFENQLILEAYLPILPKHVWSKYSLDEIASATGATPYTNEPPVVGTGPYQAVEWKPGEFIRFARNPNYWGLQGAADEVIIHHFSSPDTMVAALKTGEIDYVRGVLADQFDALKNEPGIETVEGVSNGYSQIAFNTKGNTDGYKGSTSALTDPAFRVALAWAIDQNKLVDATLGGYGEPGTTIIPPFHTRWHVEPDASIARTFDIDKANTLLDAAGYKKDGQGRRLDKEGNPIVLRVTWPDSEAQHSTDAEFIQGWWGKLGVGVDAYVTEEGKLIEDVTPPPGGPANFDVEIWGWVGDPDPTSLLDFLRTDQIGGSSDSFYSNPEYDQLFLDQRAESDPVTRKADIAQMQQLVYRDAPYIILYYDSELHAYRTDKFTNWTIQPSVGGTPLFGYGPRGYTFLQAISAATPAPAASPDAGSTPTPSASGSGSSSSGDITPVIIGGVIIVVIVGGVLLLRRRGSVSDEE
ncbi:MAG: ABC transporter substrate-binding protein [Chloroflexota bacterium]